MIKKYLFGSSFLILAISVIVSCDVIYIPDPIDPRLPKYTEDGNNVGGALINDEVWKSDGHYNIFGTVSSDPPIVYYNSVRDSLYFSFSGNLEDGPFTIISFGMRDFDITNLAEMTKLNGQIIMLDGIIRGASLEPIPGNQCQTQPMGQLYLRSVKYNLESKYLTMSGTFGFNYNDPDCDNVAVTYGRFDFSTASFYPL